MTNEGNNIASHDISEPGMKGMVRTVIICTYSNPIFPLLFHPLSLKCLIMILLQFILLCLIFFSTLRNTPLYHWESLPFVPFEEREQCRVTSKKNQPKSNGDRVRKKPHFVFKPGYKIKL